MNYNLKRPKRIDEEDEEDLLKFQEEFLKNRKSTDVPAAKVIKKKDTDNVQSTQATRKNITKKIDYDFQADNQTLATVLVPNVIEKPFLKEWNDSSTFDEPFVQTNEIGQVEKLNLNEISNQLPADRRKNKSLFAQNLELKGRLKAHFRLDQVQQPKLLQQDEKIVELERRSLGGEQAKKFDLKLADQPRKQLITGQGLGNVKDVEQIHLENLQVLSKMNPDEILEEQKKLMTQLDPRIVAFIRNRNNPVGKQTTDETTKSKTNEPKYKEEDIFEQLDLKIDKKWLHMDKIEFDKLEWMLKPKKLQQTSDSGDEAQAAAARFDFAGNLVKPDADVSVKEALHHHGNEPDVPGYSLDELFHLARSNFNQQRVIALQTLANIIAKCHQGYYEGLIRAERANPAQNADDDEKENDQNNLLNQLVEGGVLFLLRWNLDDQTESIINVSLEAIKNLLQPAEQESTLDWAFDLPAGVNQLCLHPFSSFFQPDDGKKFNLDANLNLAEKRKDLAELKDDQFIQQDLVRGLLRMNLIERFHYLLNHYQPQLSTKNIVSNVFSILYRMCRHSAEMCFELTSKYTYFIDFVFGQQHFWPLYVKPEDENDLEPIIWTLKFMRLLSCTGPTTAYKLYTKFNVKQRLVNYLTVNRYLTDDASIRLQIESVRLLKTFISYSNSYLGFDCLFDCYELMLSLMRESKSDVLFNSLVSLFDVLLCSETTVSKHEICASVFSLISTYTMKKFQQLTAEDVATAPDLSLTLVTNCLSYVVDYLERVPIESKFTHIQLLAETIVEPFVNRREARNKLKFQNLVLAKLSSHSSCSDVFRQSYDKIANNNLSYLPTLLLVTVQEDNNASLEKRCGVFGFMASFCRLYHTVLRNKMSLVDDASFGNLRCFLNDDYLRSYFNTFVKHTTQTKTSTSNEFLLNKYESLFVYHCLRLVFHSYNFEDEEASRENKSDSKSDQTATLHQDEKITDKRNFYSLALSLILKLKHGDEHLLHDLIVNCLFNIDFWSALLNIDPNSTSNASNDHDQSTNILIKYFEKLELEQRHHINQTPASDANVYKIRYGQTETLTISKHALLKLESVHIYETLNQMKLTYLSNDYLFKKTCLEQARKLNHISDVSKEATKPLKTLFVTNTYTNQFLLSADWIFQPIRSEIQLRENRKKSTAQTADSAHATDCVIWTVSNCLKYIYLLEMYFSGDYLDRNTNLTTRYVNLLYVYLFDSDVFLDREILPYMYLIFFKYSRLNAEALTRLELGQKFANLMSFYDFYKYLLANYDASSFGDYLFSMYLIVPLQQQYPIKLRDLFWSDYAHLFKYLKFDNQNSSDNRMLLKMANFVRPNEKNLHMIRLYSQILLDPQEFQLVSQSKLGYTILIAHLNAFIFEHVNQLDETKKQVEFEFKKLLLKQFLSMCSEKVKNDLINFKCLRESDEEIELYDQLPNLRKQWLEKLMA